MGRVPCLSLAGLICTMEIVKVPVSQAAERTRASNVFEVEPGTE